MYIFFSEIFCSQGNVIINPWICILLSGKQKQTTPLKKAADIEIPMTCTVYPFHV